MPRQLLPDVVAGLLVAVGFLIGLALAYRRGFREVTWSACITPRGPVNHPLLIALAMGMLIWIGVWALNRHSITAIETLPGRESPHASISRNGTPEFPGEL